MVMANPILSFMTHHQNQSRYTQFILAHKASKLTKIQVHINYGDRFAPNAVTWYGFDVSLINRDDITYDIHLHAHLLLSYFLFD